MRFWFLLIPLCYAFTARSQEAVFLTTSDSVHLRAELYLQNNNYPFIILLHDRENDSEFSKVAPRLLHLNYNCLTVSVSSKLNSYNDINAAIAYSRRISDQPVILLGGTRCASFCLLTAIHNSDVKAVIALSPGEYFQPDIIIGKKVKDLEQQVLVCTTLKEFPYIQQMFAGAINGNITLFSTKKNTDVRGTTLLDETNPSYSEYWFELMMFFKKLESD